MSSIQLLNPLDLPNWDELISRHPTATPFHSFGWARVLRDTYGFTPYYACVFKGETLSTCLPLMEINSFLTGRRGVSLPFTDFCAPLLNGTVSSRELTDFALALGRDRHWKYLELRSSEFSAIPNALAPCDSRLTNIRWKMEDGSGKRVEERGEKTEESKNSKLSPGSLSLLLTPDSSPKATPASRTYSHHVLDLTPGPDRLFKNLRESTRRNIRKSEKEGLTVRFATNLEAVKTYFRLHCLTRKRHGVPPQPYSFFANLHQHLISPGQGMVALADYQGMEVAGAVFLTMRDRAIFKFGASDSRYHAVRPNNLVMWEAIRRLAEDGFRTLSFGRTDPGNKGLIRFKSGWRTVEKRLDYFRYDFSKQNFISGNKKGPAGYERVFQKLPEPALRLMGKVLYRHFGS